MLRSVIENYLDSLTRERQFDLPILALLPAMGFFDVHYTHGTAEFGKDFIAKRVDDGNIIQYSFQSKKGDISQADWRNNIMWQMIEAVVTTLSHPSFDSSLPHQSVLITTGRLLPNAALQAQDLNRSLVAKYNALPITLWDREELITLFTDHGFDGIYSQLNAADSISYGKFFVAYGEARRGTLSDRKIEKYSRQWCRSESPMPVLPNLSVSVMEAEILTKELENGEAFYEAFVCHAGLIRAILYSYYLTNDESDHSALLELYPLALAAVSRAGRLFIEQIQAGLKVSEKGVFGIVGGRSQIMTYPIICSRILEAAGTLYFLTNDPEDRYNLVSFLEQLTRNEPGSWHLVGDRYAVSLVAPCLAFKHSGRVDLAVGLLQRALVWIGDRVEQGAGLGDVEGDAYNETVQLLGFPFSCINVRKRSQSFGATCIADLAAFTGDIGFYEVVINDIQACSLACPYWQVQDSEGQFMIDGEDVVHYPNVQFEETLSHFGDRHYAEHIRTEIASFRSVGHFGVAGHLLTSLLIRDRYFPGLWDEIVSPP